MKKIIPIFIMPLLFASSCNTNKDPYLGATYTYSNYSIIYGLGMDANQFYETLGDDEIVDEASMDLFFRARLCVGDEFKTFNFAPTTLDNYYRDDEGKTYSKIYQTGYVKESESQSKVGVAVAEIENTEIELKEDAGNQVLKDYTPLYRYEYVFGTTYLTLGKFDQGTISDKAISFVFEIEYEINNEDKAEAKYTINFTR
ncbi:MAG: hypothetical protein K5906_04690 [Bacilli bacterium]|nr:hypothetical protein [Bacilli bacterium]